MAHYTSDIQFYIGDELTKEYNIVSITQAYELASEKYADERNRRLYAAILILNKQVMSLGKELPVKSESTGIERTEFQSISALMSAYNQQIEDLKSQIKAEGLNSSGFALNKNRTWE